MDIEEIKLHIALIGAIVFYLPLLCTWVRVSLLLVEKVPDFLYPRNWFWVANALSALIVFALGLLIQGLVLYIKYYSTKVVVVPLIQSLFLALLILAVTVIIWLHIREEFVTSLNRRGM